MKPICEIPQLLCKNLRYVFTDIDDTITSEGMLPAESYSALWRLHKVGIRVVPVTGRPAGWCDFIARMWPVAGVVGENGAFYFSYDKKQKKVVRKYAQSEQDRAEGRKRLERLRERVLCEVSGCAIASDQEFRIADLAIDFCEDVTPLSDKAVERICLIAAEEGTTFKVSSIHVNCWYGVYDKLTCFNLFLQDFAGKSLDEMQEHILFCGDSQNDEPMFERLKYTIAVANITKFLPKLVHFPAFVTEGSSAKGFTEAVRILLEKRQIPETPQKLG